MADDQELTDATDDMWADFAPDEEGDPGAGLPADVAAKLKRQDEQIKKLTGHLHEKEAAEADEMRTAYLASIPEDKRAAAEMYLAGTESPADVRRMVKGFNTIAGLLPKEEEPEVKEEETEEEAPDAFAPPSVGEPIRVQSQAEKAYMERFERLKDPNTPSVERARTLIEMIAEDDPDSLPGMVLHRKK